MRVGELVVHGNSISPIEGEWSIAIDSEDRDVTVYYGLSEYVRTGMYVYKEYKTDTLGKAFEFLDEQGLLQ